MRISVLFLAVILMIVVFYLFASRQGLKYDWNETLDQRSEEPYGLKHFYELFEASYGDELSHLRGRMRDSLPHVSDSLIYFFLGQEMYLDTTDADRLAAFVRDGNTAFIACEGLPFEILQSLGLRHAAPVDSLTYSADSSISIEWTEETWEALHPTGYIYPELAWHDDTIRHVFADPTLNPSGGYRFFFAHADTLTLGTWLDMRRSYFDDTISSEFGTEALCYQDGNVVMFVVPHGRGKVIFHLAPRLFTNYYLKDEQGYDYLNACLAHLPEDQPILWDTYHRDYHYEFDEPVNQGGSLKYIFRQPSLRYAWYTLLGAALLFFLFTAKRRQRIIPIMPALENTSVEYAKALSILYFQSDSPKYLVREMMRQFHAYNRRRFNINVPPIVRPQDIDAIARRSKNARETIQRIFDLERQLTYNQHARMSDVMPLFKAINAYYQNTTS